MLVDVVFIGSVNQSPVGRFTSTVWWHDVTVNQVAEEITVLSWWRGTVVERRSLVGELSLSCARPAADG